MWYDSSSTFDRARLRVNSSQIRSVKHHHAYSHQDLMALKASSDTAVLCCAVLFITLVKKNLESLPARVGFVRNSVCPARWQPSIYTSHTGAAPSVQSIFMKAQKQVRLANCSRLRTCKGTHF